MTARGERLPRLGLGTWRMGEEAGRRDDEIAALRLGLDRRFPPPDRDVPLESR